MCDLDGESPDCYQETWQLARKQHGCSACNESIFPGHRYWRISGRWDGHWGTFKHCARCHTMFEILCAEAEVGGGVDLELNCGVTWEEAFGEPPPEKLARLAFVLQGETR